MIQVLKNNRPRRTLVLVTLLAFCWSIMLSGCGVTGSIDRAIGSFNRAISTVAELSDQWKQVANDLVPKLQAAGHQAIANDLQNLATRSINDAGVQFRCNVDYLRRRSQQILMSLKEALVKDEKMADKKGSVPPYFCSPSPAFVDLYVPIASRTNIVVYGFDLDALDKDNKGITLTSVHKDGTRQDVSAAVFKTSFYQIVIDISPSGVQITPEIRSLEIGWGGKVLSEVPVIGPKIDKVQIVPQQDLPWFLPKLTKGDADFDGTMIITARVRLEVLDDKTRLVARVFMVGHERDEESTVEGEQNLPGYWLVQYTNGERIRRILSAQVDELHFVPPDNETTTAEIVPPSKRIDGMYAKPIDSFLLSRIPGLDMARQLSGTTANGLVAQWHVRATKPDNSAEVYTGVSVRLNTVVLEIETAPADTERDVAVKEAMQHAEAQLKAIPP
jgi:hypothetical protein